MATPPRHRPGKGFSAVNGSVGSTNGTSRRRNNSNNNNGESSSASRSKTAAALLKRGDPAGADKNEKKRGGLPLRALATVELAGFAVWAFVLGFATCFIAQMILSFKLQLPSRSAAFWSAFSNVCLVLGRHFIIGTTRGGRSYHVSKVPFFLRATFGPAAILHLANAVAFYVLVDDPALGAVQGLAFSLLHAYQGGFVVPFSVATSASKSKPEKEKRGARIFRFLARRSELPAAAFVAIASSLFASPAWSVFAASSANLAARAVIAATYNAFMASPSPAGAAIPRTMLREADDEDTAGVDVLIEMIELADGATVEEAFIALPLEPLAIKHAPVRRSGLLEFAHGIAQRPGTASDRSAAIRRWWIDAVGRASMGSSSRLRDVLVIAAEKREAEVVQCAYTAAAAEPGWAFTSRKPLPIGLGVVRARAFAELLDVAKSTSAKRARSLIFSGATEAGGMNFMRVVSACTAVVDALCISLEIYVKSREAKPTVLLEDAGVAALDPHPADAKHLTDAERASIAWSAQRKAQAAKSRAWWTFRWWRKMLIGPFDEFDPIDEQRRMSSSEGKLEALLLGIGRRSFKEQACALLADAHIVGRAAEALSHFVERSSKEGEDDHRVAFDCVPVILRSLLRLQLALDEFDANLTQKTWGVAFPTLSKTRGRRGPVKRLALPPRGLELLEVLGASIARIASCIVTDPDDIDAITFDDASLNDCLAQFSR